MARTGSSKKRHISKRKKKAVILTSTSKVKLFRKSIMAEEKYQVTTEGLNIREEPSIHGKVIEVLSKGDEVELISISGDDYWYKVKTSNETEGWAAHKYLRKVVETPESDWPWLTIALAETGIHEFPGDADNPRVVEYLHSTNLGSPSWNEDETPWCSAFVNWCIEKAGYEGTDSAWARSWLNWGKEIKEPVVGCVAVFKREGGGHVGFYIGKTETAIRVLGGNQGDAVNESSYAKSRLLGYRVPGV